MSWPALLTAADRAVLTALGEPDGVTYAPSVGLPVVVEDAIFELAHQEVDASQPGVTSSGPAVFFLLADLPSDPETDAAATITAGGVTYRAAEVIKDGQGGVLLKLHRTA